MRNTKGFTLIELMVVVAVIGVLAAIAIPTYESYVIKSNRSATQAFMMDVQNRQKQYLLDARSYASTLAQLSIAEPSEVSRFYTISIATSSPPPTFIITATPIAGTRQADDGALTLTNDGAKTPADKW